MVNPARKLLADRLPDASHPAHDVAVGLVVTEVTAVPPTEIGTGPMSPGGVQAITLTPN